MCESCFVDRRPHAAPSESDFIEPLTRQSVAEANTRIRKAQRGWEDPDAMDARIRDLAVKRHRARRSERGDFGSVGDYLQHFAD